MQEEPITKYTNESFIPISNLLIEMTTAITKT